MTPLPPKPLNEQKNEPATPSKATVRQYENNLQRAVTYISQHLDAPLTLEALAKVSHFSKFHFARLFKAFTGETPGELIRRLRLEKAAYMLIYNERQSITEIAHQCGFSSSQNMARGFRIHYASTPVQFRKKWGDLPLIEKNQSIRRALHADETLLHYTDLQENDQRRYFDLSSGLKLGTAVRIEAMPDTQVIYTREIGRYEPNRIMKAVNRMFAFANPRGLITAETPLFCVFWDNAAVTDDHQCRVDCCVAYSGKEIPEQFSVQTLEGGKMAFYTCEVRNRDFYAHWNALLRHWLPSSGYELDHRPCIEIYAPFPNADTVTVQMQIGIPLAG